MSSFKLYYNINRQDKIFEKIFTKFYENKYFGDIEESLIREHQHIWFKKFIKLIETKNYEELLVSMESRENKFSREIYDKVIGSKIKYRTKEEVTEELIKFCGEN